MVKTMNKIRNFCIFAFVALLTASVAAQVPRPEAKPAPTPSDSDVVKISTTIIQLDVSVVDSRGRVVKDVRPDEIEIYENGKKQQITNFSFVSSARPDSKEEDREAGESAKTAASELPLPATAVAVRPEQVRRAIAIVVDDLFLSAESAYNTRRALKKFVNQQMVEGDLVAIVRTGAGAGTLQQFTSDKYILNAAVERVKWNPGGYGGGSPFTSMGPSFAELVKAETGEDTASATASSDQFNQGRADAFAIGTFGALRHIIDGMEELPGRKSVVMFSEGWMMFRSDRLEVSRNLGGELAKVIDAANRAGAVFYPIDPRGLQYTGITAADQLSIGTASGGSILPTPQRMASVMTQRNDQLWHSHQGMDTLAKETGGFFVKNTNDLAGGIRKILQDQSYYLIAYEPESDTFDAAKQKFNKIEVKVLRKGLTARYRSGFFNFADEQAKRPDAAAATPVAQLQRALVSPFAVNDIGLSLNPVYGNDVREGDFVRSLLHIKASDLKFVDDPSGKKRAEFSILAMSFGANGASVDQLFKDFTIEANERIYKKIQEEGFVYFFNFPIKKPGAYQYRVALRDKLAGTLGSANQFIEVPNLKKGRHHISGILLQSFTADQWKKIEGDSNVNLEVSDPMNDTALRRFRTGSVVRYGFEVYNAQSNRTAWPSLTAKVRVFRNGKIVLDGSALSIEMNGQTDPKRILSGGAIDLGSGMEPGDYVLQVIVFDNGAKKDNRVATQFVQFEIE